MRGNFIIGLLFFFILFTNFFSAFGQTSIKSDSTYLWFDQIVGIENTGLVDGVEYEEEHRVINEKTKFFKSRDFLAGTVTYKNQSYFGLQIKYDVHENDVLVRLPNRIGGTTLRLVKGEIQDFNIDGHAFVALEDRDAEGIAISGFYENPFKGTYLVLYTEHKKSMFKQRDRKILYHEFIDGINEHIIKYQTKFYRITGKKDLIDFFPQYKKEIRAHYKKNKTREKRREESFMSSLINLIDNGLIASEK